MSAIEMLSYANYEINLQRLEGIKPDQNEDDASLFSSSLPIKNYLFGGDSKTLIKRIELSKKAIGKSRENTSKKYDLKQYGRSQGTINIKSLYFLVQLRRAGVGAESLINFNSTVLRPVLEYGAQVFHHKLQDYLCEDLGRVQKQAFPIIAPGLPYQLCLDSFELESLSVRREKLCCKLFNEIFDEQHISTAFCLQEIIHQTISGGKELLACQVLKLNVLKRLLFLQCAAVTI